VILLDGGPLGLIPRQPSAQQGMKKIRLGAGSASWGDMLDPAVDLVKYGNLDYIGFDHLAELTLSILQRMKAKDPKRGYIPDLIPWTQTLLPLCHTKGIRMLTNAGGANPEQGGEEVLKIAKAANLPGLKVGVVVGDDIFNRIEDIHKRGIKLANMDTGEEDIDRIMDRIVAANVYIGSERLVEALGQGADVVVTGRCTDNALYIAPMVHEFGWAIDDWDKIAAGITIGHIIECTTGCTGGMSNFWKDIKEPWRAAFPIAEVYENGDAIITKPQETGRFVTEWTVKEHLVYEVHDPRNYLMADGIADLTHLAIKEVAKDEVRVTGFKGKPKPKMLKLCIGYEDGWIGESEISVSWPDALEKAKFCESFLRGRFKEKNLEIQEIRVDYIGVNSLHGPLATVPHASELNEVRVRVAVRTSSKEVANLVRREVTHLWTHGPVGSTAVISPPPPRQVISLWPTLIPREEVPTRLIMREV
jgi:hypothetical protein